MIRGLVWLLWAVAIGAFAVVVLSGAAAEDGDGSAVAVAVFVVSFATVGALVASRQPRNPIGWILLSAGLAYVVAGLAVNHVEGGGRSGLLAWLSTWVWAVGLGPVATFGLLLFPDGRLPSRRWRALAWAAGAANALLAAGIALEPGRFEGSTIENPFGLAAAPAVPGVMASGGLLLLAVAIFGSIASLFARFRRAHSTDRQQLKWLTYSGAIVGAALVITTVVETVIGERAANATNTVISLAVAAVPVAMGIAILRHGLYDIDVVINRTLVYAALTATLALGYLGSVLLFGLLLGPFTDSGLAVAVSTLAVAALFRPARARIQGAVDRRFYRRRYDAALTLEAFGGRLRDEVDLEALRGDLQATVRDSVQPAHVSVWLRR